ncbi:hypothetical protein ACWDTT_15950 [Streptosporangium sandarakinum]
MNVFATGTHTERLREANAIIARRRSELADIQAEIAEVGEDDDILGPMLALRLLALTMHIAGWQDYINRGCPREERAQVDQAYYHRTRTRTTAKG